MWVFGLQPAQVQEALEPTRTMPVPPLVNHGVIQEQATFTAEYITPFRTNLGATRREAAQLSDKCELTKNQAAGHGFSLCSASEEMERMEHGRVLRDELLSGVAAGYGRWVV